MIGLAQDQEVAARELFERELRDGQPIAPEYPLVFGPQFPGRTIAVEEGSEVRSACTLLTREFVTASGGLRGGMIGSVTTDHRHRSRGYGSRLLLEAEAALQIEGCAFALLWTSDPRLYTRLGYCPIGAEQDFRVSTECLATLPESSCTRVLDLERDAEAVHALYAAQPTRVERNAEETAALLTCPDMTALVLERDGQTVAYALRGRGRDFADTIHEWGGAIPDVLALVRAHLVQRFGAQPGALLLLAPTSAADLREALLVAGAQTERGILGWGKLLSREAAANFLDESMGPDVHVDVVPQDEITAIRVTSGERSVVLGDEAALALMLGADPVRDSVELFKREFGCEQAQLPLEPFAWGLDSI